MPYMIVEGEPSLVWTDGLTFAFNCESGMIVISREAMTTIMASSLNSREGGSLFFDVASMCNATIAFEHKKSPKLLDEPLMPRGLHKCVVIEPESANGLVGIIQSSITADSSEWDRGTVYYLDE